MLLGQAHSFIEILVSAICSRLIHFHQTFQTQSVDRSKNIPLALLGRERNPGCRVKASYVTSFPMAKPRNIGCDVCIPWFLQPLSKARFSNGQGFFTVVL